MASRMNSFAEDYLVEQLAIQYMQIDLPAMSQSHGRPWKRLLCE